MALFLLYYEVREWRHDMLKYIVHIALILSTNLTLAELTVSPDEAFVLEDDKVVDEPECYILIRLLGSGEIRRVWAPLSFSRCNIDFSSVNRVEVEREIQREVSLQLGSNVSFQIVGEPQEISTVREGGLPIYDPSLP